jgi:hypothetical protein
VVGINSFGATDAEGLNFALPSYTAWPLLNKSFTALSI